MVNRYMHRILTVVFISGNIAFSNPPGSPKVVADTKIERPDPVVKVVEKYPHAGFWGEDISNVPVCGYCGVQSCSVFAAPDSIRLVISNGAVASAFQQKDIRTIDHRNKVTFNRYVGYTETREPKKTIDTSVTVDFRNYNSIVKTAVTGGLFHLTKNKFYSGMDGGSEFSIYFFMHNGDTTHFHFDNRASTITPATLLSIKEKIEKLYQCQN